MGCRASQGGWESLRASHTSELVALWVGGAHSFVFLRLPPYMYRTVCIYIYIYTYRYVVSVCVLPETHLLPYNSFQKKLQIFWVCRDQARSEEFSSGLLKLLLHLG